MLPKKTGIALIAVTLISLALAAVSLAVALRNGPAPAAPAPTASAETASPAPETAEPEGDLQFILYLGTNDKDTNEPVFTPEEAKDRAVDILFRYVTGYTIQEAHGGWVDDSGTRFAEYSLVISLSYTDLDTVHALSDELITVFRQSSVLIETNRTVSEYYSGPAAD